MGDFPRGAKSYAADPAPAGTFHIVNDEGSVGSNPLTPTNKIKEIAKNS
jgi:hypothetical protein